MRVLHILHRSIPGTHGYAIRSREIVQHQLDKGIEPIVITSPSQSPMQTLDSEGSELIEGVRYFRTGNRLLASSKDVKDSGKMRAALRIIQNTSLFKKSLYVAHKYNPDVVHGHSPFTCGLIANSIGRIRRIPSVYEMRGIWEDSHVARHKMAEDSITYKLVRYCESRAIRGADLCCFICESLKQEVLARGIVNESRTLITPNGVDLKRFYPNPADEGLKKDLGLSGKRIIGYIGTFFHYEGLDILLEAMIRIVSQYRDISLLLVGDGELMPLLKERVATAGIDQKVVFTGLVPNDKVPQYYGLCDYMVLPRRDTRETRLVTPLKPMEIMAMAKPLVASDIGGHRDSVIDGVNGILFKSEDLDDLCDKLTQLIEHHEIGEDLGKGARAWVEKNRSWDMLVERYSEAYNRLLSRS